MKSGTKNRPGTRTTARRFTSSRTMRSVRSNGLRSQTKIKPSMIRILLICIFLLFVIVIGLWILRTFNPFYTFNPFLKEITVGQTVIGSWHYGGLDGSGNMRFYHDTNGFQTVLIPPSLNRFAADGQFVILLDHSPVSLTFETRGQYLMQTLFQMITIFTILAVALLVIAQFAFQKSKPGAFRSSKQKRP